MHDLVWTQGMEIGLPELDMLRHHFVLKTNKLIQTVGKVTSPEDVEKIIKEIEDLVYSIKTFEKKLLSETQNTELQKALQDHIKKLEAFSIDKAHLSHDNIESYKLMVSEYLSRWYFEHIVGEDLALRSLIANSDIGGKYQNKIISMVNNFIHSISIKRGLPLILLILILPSLVLTSMMLNEARDKVETYDNVINMSELYLSLSNSIYELQKERGISSAHIASGGTVFEDELLAAILRSDNALKNTLHKLSVNKQRWQLISITEYATELNSTIDVLGVLREMVDRQQFGHLESTEAYTRFIGKMIQLSDNMERLDTDINVRNTITAMNAINHMMEAAGLERATGAAGFSSGHFDKVLQERLSVLVATQDIMFSRFKSMANADQYALFNRIVDSDLRFDLDEFRALAFQDVADLKDNDISRVWWDFTTHRINQLSSYSKQLLALLSKDANKAKSDAEQIVMLTLIVSLCLILLVWLTSWVLIVSFRRPVIQVANAMSELAKGNHEVIISETNRINEIGDLIHAYETFRMRLLRANFADQIFTETKLTRRLHAIELKKEMETSETYKKEALEDFLTGVANRRSLLIYAGNILERSKGRKNSPSMLLMDIDNFKQINDRYGHLAGDEVLKTLADKTNELLREEDLLARIGGEEFAVLLPATSLQEARFIAQRICQTLASLEVFVNEGDRIQFTVSIGIAGVTDQACTIENILSNADEALYTAKNTGKNRVIVYGDSEQTEVQNQI